MNNTLPRYLETIEAYICQFVALPERAWSLPLALWAVNTHIFEMFDAFPYLAITAATKQAGKSVLMEVLSFISHEPRMVTGATGPSLFKHLTGIERKDKRHFPTLFMDEAERQSSEDVSSMRELVNCGYRRGGTISRASQDYPAYCPKAFALIGGVNDTLNDRSIVITLVRGKAARRYTYSAAQADGADIQTMITQQLLTLETVTSISGVYRNHDGLAHLFESGREEEIWLPLFASCAVLCPDRMDELERTSVDLAMSKTGDRKNYRELKGAEGEALNAQYAERLVRDIHTLLTVTPKISTEDVLKALCAMPTGPWRKFRGAGLTDQGMSDMLRPFGIRAKNIRFGARKDNKVKRGYTLTQFQAVIDTM